MKTIHKCMTGLALVFTLPLMATPAKAEKQDHSNSSKIQLASMQADKSSPIQHQAACGCAACQAARQIMINKSTA